MHLKNGVKRNGIVRANAESEDPGKLMQFTRSFLTETFGDYRKYRDSKGPDVVFSRTYSHRNEPASVAQLDAPSDWRPGGRGFNPRRGRQHSFVEIDHEIFSTVILSLPLIQEGQLSVSGERMCTVLVNSLED